MSIKLAVLLVTAVCFWLGCLYTEHRITTSGPYWKAYIHFMGDQYDHCYPDKSMPFEEFEKRYWNNTLP